MVFHSHPLWEPSWVETEFVFPRWECGGVCFPGRLGCGRLHRSAPVTAASPPDERPDPKTCVVLVPVGGAIDPGCEDVLRELERRGYAVWRLRRYSTVDAARNQMATEALVAGFDDLMWIDADVAFDPGRRREAAES